MKLSHGPTRRHLAYQIKPSLKLTIQVIHPGIVPGTGPVLNNPPQYNTPPPIHMYVYIYIYIYLDLNTPTHLTLYPSAPAWLADNLYQPGC